MVRINKLKLAKKLKEMTEDGLATEVVCKAILL